MFSIGDRVILIADEDRDGLIVQGQIGTVCDKDSYGDIGVRWDDEMNRAHDCNGKCEYKHGWYVDPEDIELLRNEMDMDMTGIEELILVCSG